MPQSVKSCALLFPLELLLKHNFSSAHVSMFKVYHIVVASPGSGHYLLCTAHLSTFKIKFAHYRCCFYLIVLHLMKLCGNDVYIFHLFPDKILSDHSTPELDIIAMDNEIKKW